MRKKPSCNQEKYNETLERGFKKFPKRKENHEKFLRNLESNFSLGIDYMPIKMDYEVSSICNFRCTMCLMSELSGNRPPNMTLEDFKRSIDERYGLVEVKLQGLGEPLLNKDFFEMVDYVVNKDIWTRTTTNASILHVNNTYKKLIDSGIGEIQISLDGATKETFEKIRVGANFEQIKNNIILLNNYAESKDELWKTSCWVMIQSDNIHEIKDILCLAATLKFKRVVFQMSMNDFGRDEWKINSEKSGNKYMNADLEVELYQRGQELGIEVSFWDNDGRYKRGDRCIWLFSRAYITAKMEVTPCCMHWVSDDCYMGSAENFGHTWYGERYDKLRQIVIEGDIPQICKYCYGLRDEE